MAKKDGGPAFPQIETDPASTADHPGDTGQEYSHVYSYGGMSLRDWFAGHAPMKPIDWSLGQSLEIDALRAYRWADAMLKARDED